ncbi:hypothetical protein OAG24_00455 [bacterium]|nr:hypothetical protein [bacterium]
MEAQNQPREESIIRGLARKYPSQYEVVMYGKLELLCDKKRPRPSLEKILSSKY